jgi:hypothetical protein
MEPKKTLYQAISESFDFEGLSPEEQEQANIDLQNMILENTLLRIFDESNPSSTKKYELFQKQIQLYGDSPKSTLTFLTKEIPEFYTIFFEELEMIKNNM